MRVAIIWMIREARDLSCNEKVFLYTVESRGVMYSSAEVAASDMGLSRSTFYKVRDSLQRKGLLIVRERANLTTQYRVSKNRLASWPRSDQSRREPEVVDWDELDQPTPSANDKTSVCVKDRALREATPEVDPQEDREAERKLYQEQPEENQKGEPKGHPEARTHPHTSAKLSELVDDQTLTPSDLEELDGVFRTEVERRIVTASHNGETRISDALKGWIYPTPGQGQRTFDWQKCGALTTTYVVNSLGNDAVQRRGADYIVSVTIDDQPYRLVGEVDDLTALIYLSDDFREVMQLLVEELTAQLTSGLVSEVET